MSSNSPRSIQLPTGGFLHDLMVRIKLVLRLVGDRRVSPWLKALPIGAAAYAVIPFDIPGPIDDALVLWLGTTLFVELCPSAVVQEHIDQLTNTPPVQWPEEKPPEDIVEAEFRDVGGKRPDETRKPAP